MKEEVEKEEEEEGLGQVARRRGRPCKVVQPGSGAAKPQSATPGSGKVSTRVTRQGTPNGASGAATK